MRGADSYNESLFSTNRLEAFVPADHPLRPIRAWFNEALSGLDAKFSAMHERDVKGDRLQPDASTNLGRTASRVRPMSRKQFKTARVGHPVRAMRTLPRTL
jgi:hypothetical protein